jgi:3-hydroxybutyryl-CoA dehydrogenase
MIANRGCAMDPMGTIDVIGMKTAFDILTYWGHENGDRQMLANADYIKTNFIDQGRVGLQTGHGYYRYPNPGYQDPDFPTGPSGALPYAGGRSGAGWELSSAGSGSVRP